MNKIRVMNVYNNLYYGGTEEYIKQVINALDKNRYEISICCLIERGPNTEWFEKQGIKIFSLDARNKPIIKNILRNLVQVVRLAKLLKREKTQIVHTHDFFPGFLTRLACIISDTPVVFLTLHNLFEWLNKFHHFTNRILAKKTTKIIAVSKSVMARSIQYDKIPESKYVVIYNAIDTEKFSPCPSLQEKFRTELKIKNETFIIGCVGGFSKRKGQKYLLKAFIEFQKKVDNSILLFIGGGDSNEPEIKEELLRIIHQNNIQNKIIFTGPRKDISEFINVLDLFVLPSIVEGFGYAAVEALSLELPVLLSDISTFREITNDGQFGVLFKTRNEKDLLDKLIYCFENLNSLKKIASDGRKHVINEFGLDTFNREYSLLYDSASDSLLKN
jgi:L-malate glycosyltransferase